MRTLDDNAQLTVVNRSHLLEEARNFLDLDCQLVRKNWPVILFPSSSPPVLNNHYKCVIKSVSKTFVKSKFHPVTLSFALKIWTMSLPPMTLVTLVMVGCPWMTLVNLVTEGSPASMTDESISFVTEDSPTPMTLVTLVIFGSPLMTTSVTTGSILTLVSLVIIGLVTFVTDGSAGK